MNGMLANYPQAMRWQRQLRRSSDKTEARQSVGEFQTLVRPPRATPTTTGNPAPAHTSHI